MSDLLKLTIKEAHEMLKKGETTSVKLTESFLDSIKEKNRDLNVYLEIYKNALDQAKKADEMIAKGDIKELTGIPIAVKDNILVEGEIASAASKILENYKAAYDATVIEKLKEQGAVLIGRTNMDEFAMGSSTEQSAFGVAKNPIDPKRVPGGSSGGSAASVAANMALGALGSDTAGSIRQPSSFCGVVGLKPTYGSVSRHGLIALGSSLDVIGPIAKTVTDAEIIFNVISGKDKMDSTTVDEKDFDTSPGVKTVGVPRSFIESSNVDKKVLENYEKSLKKLEGLGYNIVDIELPNIHYGVPAYYILLPAEASANLARFDGVRYGHHGDGEGLLGDYLVSRGEGFGEEPRRRILIGTYVLSAGYYDSYYRKAFAIRQLIRADFSEAFEKVDVIALPTTAGPAFKIGEKIKDPIQMYLEDVFTVPANHAGIPAISVPSGTVEEDGKDLPLGVQFLSPHMGEKRLFEIGKKFLGEN